MSGRGDSLGGLVVIGLVVWWWSTRGDTVSAYWVLNETGEKEAEERFSADRASNTVTEFMAIPGRDTGVFTSYKNCAVFDHKNWHCEIGYESINGHITGSTFESDSRVHSVNWLGYLLAPSPKSTDKPAAK